MTVYEKPLRVLVIIPAWNEESSVADVIAEIRATHMDLDIVVVNDCSTDRTSTVARECGVNVVDLPINLGVGGAMRTGYCFARDNNYDAAVQIDADGQHIPEEIRPMIAGMITESANLVIGARFAGKGNYVARGPRRWAMTVLSKILSRVTHAKLTDSTSGLKIADRRVIELFAHDFPAEYLGDTIESLVLVARSGLRVRQVPVEMRQRTGGQPSHNPIKSAVFLARAGLALVVALTRPREYHAPAPREVQG